VGSPLLPAAEPVVLGLLPAAPELTPGALGGGMPFIDPLAPALGDSGACRLGSLGLEHAFSSHVHAHNAGNNFRTSIFAYGFGAGRTRSEASSCGRGGRAGLGSGPAG